VQTPVNAEIINHLPAMTGGISGGAVLTERTGRASRRYFDTGRRNLETSPAGWSRIGNRASPGP